MDFSFCSACCLGKVHNLPFSSTLNEYTAPLELVHTDLWGPAHESSTSGYRYYILFVDDFSRYTWVYILKNKSKAFHTFYNFKSQVELQLGHKIKSIQSYWGGEYRIFVEFLKTNGIHHRISCPGAHQQTGMIERKHRHVVENGLALLAQASIPYQFWGEAFRTSVYLINRLPTPTMKGYSPLESLFGLHSTTL